MVDSLGYRLKLGIVAPSTNTSVQPEMDGMRPVGVTNHFGRALIPDNPITSDADFEQLMVDIRASMTAAVEQVITCDPDRLVMGMSSETFWDGAAGAAHVDREPADVAAGAEGDVVGAGRTRREADRERAARRNVAARAPQGI